jgi:hypothetical protein
MRLAVMMVTLAVLAGATAQGKTQAGRQVIVFSDSAPVPFATRKAVSEPVLGYVQED